MARRGKSNLGLACHRAAAKSLVEECRDYRLLSGSLRALVVSVLCEPAQCVRYHAWPWERVALQVLNGLKIKASDDC